jgi:hypothetical protein
MIHSHSQVAKQREPQPPPADAIPLAVPAMGSMPNLRAHPPTRGTAIALLSTAVLLLVGCFAPWFSDDIGLLGVDGISWFDIPNAPVALELFATAGILGIAGAIAFLVHAAAMLFDRRPHKVKLVPLNASLGIAAFGCTSLFIRLSFGERALSISYGGILTLVALVAASVIIGKLVRPIARAST